MDSNTDKQRVSLLLNINTLLIQRSLAIQQQIQHQGSSANPKLQSLLQDLLKRLHANLTCIGEISEKHNNPQANQSKVVFPMILAPPQDMMDLTEMYVQLQKLFPEGVQLLQRRQMMMKQQQAQQQQQQQQTQPQQQGSQFW